jgi:2-polyprenyl-3-methyl-5-hydroxy-6-metoxy-1,4-benzoquinol methylase
MPKVICPRIEQDSINCVSVSIQGHVRDAKNVGVKQCSDCLLVTHEQDLSALVDYPAGSMHKWAGGYGQTDLRGPDGDRQRRLQKLFKLGKTLSLTKLLDFGCGSGEMLEILSPEFEVSGLEPDNKARQSAAKHGTIWESSEEALRSGQKFDIITLFHVIEHFYNPIDELHDIYELLNSGGVLVIETPNANDALLTTYANSSFQEFTYWSHHPMVHSNISLKYLMEKIGLEVYESKGCQRYGLANHLYWLTAGLPGGHNLWLNLFGEETNNGYEEDLIKQGTQDTLWIVARKSA